MFTAQSVKTTSRPSWGKTAAWLMSPPGGTRPFSWLKIARTKVAVGRMPFIITSASPRWMSFVARDAQAASSGQSRMA